MWTAAEQAVDRGAVDLAQLGFAAACDAVVEMAGRPASPVSFPDAALYAEAWGAAPPRSTPTTPAAARAAAEAAVTVLPLSPPHGMRLGLEAHVAFELLSNAQVAQMRYLFADFGPPWARVALICSRTLENPLRRPLLALHFAQWAATITGHLLPHRGFTDGVDELIRESLEQASRMEAATGDPDAARRIEEILNRPSD